MGESTESTAKQTATFDRLLPRDTRGVRARSARYSHTVGFLRWFLPLSIVVALGALFIWPTIGENAISLTVTDSVPNLMVERLNLNGLDAKNQPYTLTAARALQDTREKNLVHLENPKGELALDQGAWLAAQADQGLLNQQKKKLWLGGHVEIFHDKGYRLSSEGLNVDFDKNLAWGEQPVVIQGNFGVVKGAGFRVLDKGDTLIITGPATAMLRLQSDKGSGKPNVNHSSSR